MASSKEKANFSGTATYRSVSNLDKEIAVVVTAEFTLRPDDGILEVVVSIKNGGTSKLENPVTYKTLPAGWRLLNSVKGTVETLITSGHHRKNIGSITINWK